MKTLTFSIKDFKKFMRANIKIKTHVKNVKKILINNELSLLSFF